MNKKEYIAALLNESEFKSKKTTAKATAPSNIALIKYWGKRDKELNLPMTSSLSMSLGEYGATTQIQLHDQPEDEVILNGKVLSNDAAFVRRLLAFFDLFRSPKEKFCIQTTSALPIGAGLASSACGFAAFVKALNDLFAWQCDDKTLSLLARLGSGSACRSLWSGFVEWHKGEDTDGFDSYAEPLSLVWPEWRVGLLIEHAEEKAICSREAMNQTVATSPFYAAWPEVVQHDLIAIKRALFEKDFKCVGEIAEHNALAMHATMLAARPSILYWQSSTLSLMQKVWQLRKDGLPLYFTEDAGPNLKLLFLEKDRQVVEEHFSHVKIVDCF